MHSKLSKLLSFRSWAMRPLFVALMLTTLASCGGGPLSLLTGGGPNVAANVQAGAENTQGVNVKTEAPRVTVRPKARVDTIDQRTTNNTEIDPLLLALLIIGWLAPSPGEMWRGLTKLWRNQDGS